ncbi:hypothetical protein [Chryseobacterium sp.]|uniref:hypothetical protein n=1 Tax=Chryseobacterium sp. TaxID=1871047 RepID=UPI00289CDE21|nr:hypothetical protein [Chryseobacterium sp.]
MDVKYAYYYSSKGYKVIGGVAAQFLKADGSVDGNSYALSSHAHSNYVDLTNFQIIQGLKRFSNLGAPGSFSIELYANNGYDPGVNFHKSGIYTGSLRMTAIDTFTFFNGAGDNTVGISVNKVTAKGGVVHPAYNDANKTFTTDGGVFDLNTLSSAPSKQVRIAADGNYHNVTLNGALTVVVLEGGSSHNTNIVLPTNATAGQEVQCFNESSYNAGVRREGSSGVIGLSSQTMQRFTFVLDAPGEVVGGSGSGKWYSSLMVINLNTL